MWIKYIAYSVSFTLSYSLYILTPNITKYHQKTADIVDKGQNVSKVQRVRNVSANRKWTICINKVIDEVIHFFIGWTWISPSEPVRTEYGRIFSIFVFLSYFGTLEAKQNCIDIGPVLDLEDILRIREDPKKHAHDLWDTLIETNWIH